MAFPIKGFQNWKNLIEDIRPVIRKAINKRLFSNDIYLIEDIEQDILIKIYKSIDSYDQNKSLYDWVYILAINHVVDVLRMQKRRANIFEKKNIVFETVCEDRISTQRFSHQILTLLPENYRRVLIYRFYFGYKQREIANKLNIPVGSVSTRIQTGLQKLRILIECEALTKSDFFN